MNCPTALWELRHIVKRYPGVLANDDISLKLMPGEIHGLLGANGCGKSTLIKILSGVEQPTSGQILKDGTPISLPTPIHARRAGIATVFQEFSLVPDLSVTENIFLGRARTTPLGLTAWRHMKAETLRTLKQLGLADEIDPQATVRSLSAAQQQLVEISKAVSMQARTLILDEPTAALSLPEIERLHALLRQLKAQGHAILYVSHRLDEVVALVDVATILKDGQRVRGPGEVEIAIDPIVAAIVGEGPNKQFSTTSHATQNVLLEALGLAAGYGVTDVSFQLHAGEILGIAGIMGSGRTTLLRILFGLEPSRAGAMKLHTREPGRGESVAEYTPLSPLNAIEQGFAFIPENRKSDGLFFNFPGAENSTIASLDKFTRGTLLDFSAERRAFETLARDLVIDRRASLLTVGNLSGGNQQKIILGRWIVRDAKILLLDEPTQGIDVGAKAALYHLLRDLARQRKAIILVSSDIGELLTLSDRIAILRKGSLIDIRPASHFDEHTLSVAMAGSRPPAFVSAAAGVTA